MMARRILHQISLLVVVLWMLKAEATSKSAYPKALQKLYDRADYPKEGLFKPRITKSPVDKTIKEGKGVALYCAAAGKPKPRIKWKKNGVNVVQDKRIKIRPINAGSKLRIKNAMPQDSGIYHCVAKSSLGHKNSNKATLNVRGDRELREKNGTCRRGTCSCKPYTGSVCSRYIAKDTKVFVPLLKSQRLAEESILHALGHLKGYIHPSCKKVLTKALCYNLFPPCQSVKPARPRLLCKDECEILQARTCSKEFPLLRKRLGTSAEDTLPNCSSLPYDLEGRHAHCLQLDNTGNSSSPDRECHRSSDECSTMVEPLQSNYPICDGKSSKKVKVYNKDVFQLIRNVETEIHNGRMTLTVHSSELSTYCFTAAIPLSSLVREWDWYQQTPVFPGIKWPRNLTVPGLRVSTLNSSVDSVLVPLGSASKYRAHAKIILREVTFFYRYDVQSDSGSFIAKGKYDLCDTVFNVTMETHNNSTIKLSGSSEIPLDVSTIETVFLTASPSEMLVDAIKKTDLFVIRLMNPTIEAYISTELLVKFSGKSYFGASTIPVSLEFFGGKMHQNDILLVGISSRYMSMNQALKLFTGLNLPYLDFTQNSSSESSVGVTLSSQTLDLTRPPAYPFKQQPLSMVFADSVPQGLSLASRSSIPKKCNNSQVCELFQVIFGGGSEFSLKASTDWNEIKLSWHFHNLSKAAVTSFDTAEITMKIGARSLKSLRIISWPFPASISVDGRIYKSGQQSKSLQFSGQLKYEGEKSHLEANFGTKVVWKKAFGMKHLTMTNLQLGVSLPTNQSEGSSIRGEADLELGSGCLAVDNGGDNKSIKPKCITGHMYMGFSDASADHYFYGLLSPVSLQKLLEVCDIEHELPRALASIGFPEGLQISVSRGTHVLRGGPNLKPGFILTGKMSILGIESSGAISLLPKEFLIDAEILSDEAPDKIDDFTPLSGSDRAHSPKLYLKARVDPEPFVKAHIDGYARLFGIFDEVRMLATREALQIHLMSDVSKSLKINVHVTTNYSSNRNDTHFTATIVFENGLSKLTRLASKQVVQMLEAEMSELKSAKGDVQRRRRECNKTVKRECFNCMDNKLCADTLTSCHEERTQKSAANASKKKEDAKRVGSPLELCQRLVLERCLATEHACRNVCMLVSAKANETCVAYEAAAKSQRELERGLRWVRQAEQFMYSDLFQIHAISFKSDVTSGNFGQLYMDTSLEVTIFGQKQKLDGLRMKFNEFVKLSSEIAKYAVEWYRKTQPEAKPKLRHPDNRPRNSPS